jgi:sigma-B regulation protein RsbU (phosphoserine phosphatase)
MKSRIKGSIAVKSITVVVLIIAVFSVIICLIAYSGFTRALVAQYSEDAFWTAEMSEMCILTDKADMDLYMREEGLFNYYNALGLLQNICNSTGVEFIYVIQPDRTDYAHIKFMFAVKRDGSPYTLYEKGYIRETTNDEYKAKYKELCEGRSTREIVVRDRGKIETDDHVTVMLALLDPEDGETTGILCVQVQMEGLNRARRSYIRSVLITLIGLAVIVIVSEGLYLHFALLLPVKRITREASRFASENRTTEHRLTDKVKKNDEIGTLMTSIDRMEDQIVKHVESIKKITADTERLNTELALAAKIQADALPNVFPAFPDRPEIDLYASMNPAKEVGGDFYDFFLIDDDHLCIVMADVSGKGVPAALFMMSSKNIIATNALKSTSPAAILGRTNDALCARNVEEMFVTVWLGILQISTGIITAANAGHEYPVIMHENSSFGYIRDAHDPVIGSLEGMKYHDYEIRLQKGSKLFLYTDGLPEANNKDNSMFGSNRLLQAVNRKKEGSTKEIIENVDAEVAAFSEGAEQFDDLTMLCLEYRGPETASRKQ